MSLRQLECLVAIADTGSFHAASERLGITQSAVSMQMKALEVELRVPLFDRSRRPPVPNNAAHGLLDRAREILRLYDDFRQGAEAGEDIAGVLRLGVIPTASTGLLPRALAALSRRYPRLQLRIENGLSGDLIRRVGDGVVDAALLTEPGRLSRDLVCRTVLEERLMVVAPAGEVTVADHELLSGLPFVRFNRRAGVGRVIDAALRRRGIKVRESMELDSIEAILAMVERGLGVTVAPERSLTPAHLAELTCLPFGAPAVTRKVGLIERARDGRAPLIRALHVALVDAAK